MTYIPLKEFCETSFQFWESQWMRPELACSTSWIILTGTETKYKQLFLEIQNTNKVCCKNKIQTKFVAKTKYKQSLWQNTKYKHSLLQKQSTKRICGKSKIQKFRLQNWTGRSIVQCASKNVPISWGSFFPIPV